MASKSRKFDKPPQKKQEKSKSGGKLWPPHTPSLPTLNNDVLMCVFSFVLEKEHRRAIASVCKKWRDLMWVRGRLGSVCVCGSDNIAASQAFLRVAV